jgi:hypothetical protein
MSTFYISGFDEKIVDPQKPTDTQGILFDIFWLKWLKNLAAHLKNVLLVANFLHT